MIHKHLCYLWLSYLICICIIFFLNRPQALLDAVQKSLSCADVIVTTGGVSMGERDLLKNILTTDLNATLHFGRINMKPGYVQSLNILLFLNV